uniref:Putative metalloprotease n=1 Tax=Ixodes ricinus TaxID=34613 RepID=A0A0K8R3Y4_IXORI
MDERLPGEGVSKTTQCKRAFPKLKETYHMKKKPIVNCAMQCFMPRRVYGYDTHIAVALTDGDNMQQKMERVCINGQLQKRGKRKLSFFKVHRKYKSKIMFSTQKTTTTKRADLGPNSLRLNTN